MAAAPPLVMGLRGLFLILGFAMVATLSYTIYTDGLPFRKNLLTPWMIATLVDYYINVVPIAAWVVYKEGLNIIWILLLICLGSVTTCIYILIQLFKLSPQESLHDPIYHVLLRRSNSSIVDNGDQQKSKHSHHHIVAARVIFSVLGILMLVTLLYTIFTNGSPFRKDLLTPWLSATLIDFYINVVALSVWVIYKESSWIYAGIWVLLFICFGSIFTCAYIVKELFRLNKDDPVYRVLFNNKNRYLHYEEWWEHNSEHVTSEKPTTSESGR